MKEKVIHVDDDSGITIVMGFNLNEYNHLPFNPQPHDEAEKVANQVLDALDEDTEARKDLQNHIINLTAAIADFHKVFVTCRNQFFRNDSWKVPK